MHAQDHIATVLTRQGIYYTHFNGCTDTFVTPPYRSLPRLAARLKIKVANCRRSAEAHLYDLQDMCIEEAVAIIGKLCQGLVLEDAEAVHIDVFHQFLEATVAPHKKPNCYPVNQMTKSLVRGFTFHRTYPDLDEAEILADNILWPAFQNCAQHYKFPTTCHKETWVVSPQHQIVAGRYLRRLAHIAQISGRNRLTPAEIMRKCYLQTEHD